MIPVCKQEGTNSRLSSSSRQSRENNRPPVGLEASRETLHQGLQSADLLGVSLQPDVAASSSTNSTQIQDPARSEDGSHQDCQTLLDLGLLSIQESRLSPSEVGCTTQDHTPGHSGSRQRSSVEGIVAMKPYRPRPTLHRNSSLAETQAGPSTFSSPER